MKRFIRSRSLDKSPGVAAAAVLLGLLTAGLAALRADEVDGKPWWPHFHGPQRDNVSRETGLMKQWPAEGPKLLWKFAECGDGYSGVSIAEGTIFTAGDFDEVERVIALDLDGKKLWTAQNGESWTGPYPGSRTTPAYSEAVVYQMNPKGRLAAYRADSGEEVWAVDLVEKFGARYGTWSLTENVAVEGPLLFCVPGGSKALVVALDKKNGQTVWANNALDETAAYCSPILVTHGGVRQLITLTQKSAIGVDVQTGELLWSHPHVTPHDQNVNAPLFSDGYVFLASGHSGGGRVVKIDADNRGAKELWWDKELDNCHGSVMLFGRHLYGSSCRAGGKGFFCADFLTGEVSYREKRMTKLSLTAAEGLIYGLTQTGEVLLIQPRPDRFEVVSTFQTPEDSRALAWTHPIVCGGRLYLRRGEYLYVYDIRARS
ncbi:MAG TPA: PQQ-binding-like beta-propeller repeat protein [Thermoguttaceae bacterium]|nr:PQQ-binding-like beta-propeller repeat protein [Thermoguttaceae bacterium]